MVERGERDALYRRVSGEQLLQEDAERSPSFGASASQGGTESDRIASLNGTVEEVDLSGRDLASMPAVDSDAGARLLSELML